MVSKLCPECLSSLDPGEALCPQCGARLELGRRVRWGPVASVVSIVVVLGLVWPVLGLMSAGQDGDSRAADPPARSAVRSEGAAESAIPGPHLWLRGTEGASGPVAALALRAEETGVPALFVPLAGFPLHGALADAGGAPMPLRVLTYNLEVGFVLLTSEAPLPAAVEPIVAAGGGTPGAALGVRAPGSRERATTGLAEIRPGGGRWILTGPVPRGAALVSGGQALAYALGGGEAIPLAGAIAWLGQRGTRALDVVQQEMRQWMPEHLMAEVETLLTAPAELGAVERALVLLERARMRLRAPRDLETHGQWERRALHLRVRLLSQDDLGAALQRAREMLLRYPDHAAVRADAVLLALGTGDPSGALQLFRELQVRSLERAREIGDRLARGIVNAARGRRGGRGDALELLATATQVLPGRAELHAAYARVLSRADRPDEALAQAELAAQLDPKRVEALAGYREDAERARLPARRVVLPVDPNTGSIRADIVVGGEALKVIVDTGASFTTVPRAVAERLGVLAGSRVVKVETAGGTVEAALVTLPWLEIGPIRVEKVKAAVIDLPGGLAGKGLLGLNVLQDLNMRLDSARGRLILHQPAGRRR